LGHAWVFYAGVAGTTLGMVLANIPAVILGDGLARRRPVKAIRIAAAVLTISRMRL
jgi:putative Ca2+/H+ antiporter (TMEM165/GDT1 family)